MIFPLQDWNDLDEPSEPFIFGHRQLRHTSFAVNQAVPFNSLVEKDLDTLPTSAGRGRGRGRGKSSNQRTQNHRYTRSYSVPESLSHSQLNRDSNNNRHEDWEADTINIENDDTNNNHNVSERLNQVNNQSSQYLVNSTSDTVKPVFSEDWEGDLIETKVSDKFSDSVEDFDSGKVEPMRLPRQTDSVVFNYSVQTNVNQKGVDKTRILSPEPTAKQFCDNMNDVETTPKANDSLNQLIMNDVYDKQPSVFPPNFVSAYSPYFQPVQKTSVKKEDNQGEVSKSSSRSVTPVNMSVEDIKITPVKDPWEVLQQVSETETVTDLHSMSYRNKKLEYDTCSSGTKTSDADAASSSTSDDIFIVDQQDSELVDLTDQLQAAVLSGRSDLSESGGNVFMKNVDHLLRKTSDDYEDMESIVGTMRVPVIRQPIAPSSMLKEIWEVCKLYQIHRGSYMSAHVLLNLLNKLGKRDKMRGLPSILLLFGNQFNKFNNTGA